MVRSPSIESFTNKIEIGERGKIEEQELKKEKRGNRD